MHVILQPVHEVDQLRFRLGMLDLVRDLERHRDDRSGVVGQRRGREQDEVPAPGQPADDFRRRFLPRELAEELLDVLDLQRTLLEIVLLDVIFHGLNR